MVSQLPTLRTEFPRMTLGLCRSELSAKAFADAGMKCLVVGNPNLTGSGVIHRADWDDLAAQPLPADHVPPPLPPSP